MKKLMLLLLVAVLGTATAVAERNIVTHGDTTIITNGEDTVRFLGVNALSKRITALLDDTVLNLNRTEEQSDSTALSSVETPTDIGLHEAQLHMHSTMTDMVRDIVSYVMTGITFIVLFSLLFYYLHRRRKYKMVEKAIENNYPLPGYIFGAPQESPRVVYTPTPPPLRTGEGETQPENASQTPPAGFQSQSYQAPVGQQPVMTDQIDWRQMKGGFTLAVVGFALMLFFVVAGGTPLACMFSIMLLLGLGKMWLNYQDQKRAIAAWHQQQAWFGTQQSQHPKQPQPEQPRATDEPQQ